MSDTMVKDLPEVRVACPTSSHRMLGEGALLIDLRPPEAVAKLGFGGCDLRAIPFAEFEDRWTEIPRERALILVGDSGTQARKAAYFLMYQGFADVAVMEPGLARWIARGFPVTGDPAALAGASAACCSGAGSCCG